LTTTQQSEKSHECDQFLDDAKAKKKNLVNQVKTLGKPSEVKSENKLFLSSLNMAH